MTPRLKETYSKEIQPALKDSLGLKNIFMVPRIEKIVLNMGLGLDGADAKILKAAEEDMGKITGQKPVITKFKKSVANFKTRKGSNAGLKVTLRKNKMYEFIDRLVNIALPRIKDFRGLSPKGFDKWIKLSFEKIPPFFSFVVLTCFLTILISFTLALLFALSISITSPSFFLSFPVSTLTFRPFLIIL